MFAALLLTMILAVPDAPSNAFEVQAELQALYDEITDGTAQFSTPSDVDLFHDVLYAPDFVFVDVAGHIHSWPEIRRQAIAAIGTPLPDSSIQPIQKLTLAPDGVSVVVNMITVRMIVDRDGCYGRKGASHKLTDITPFRDRWVRVDGEWKLKSRVQIKATRVLVDKDNY
jgi:hypothetical protein